MRERTAVGLSQISWGLLRGLCRPLLEEAEYLEAVLQVCQQRESHLCQESKENLAGLGYLPWRS